MILLLRQLLCSFCVLVLLTSVVSCQKTKTLDKQLQDFESLYYSQQFEKAFKAGQAVEATGWKAGSNFLNKMGIAAMETGQYAIAFPYLEKALDTLKGLPQLDTLSYITVLSNMSKAYALSSNFYQAIKIQQEVILLRQKMSPTNWEAIGLDYFNIANFYGSIPQLSKAEEVAERAYLLYLQHSVPFNDNFTLIALACINTNMVNGDMQRADTIAHQVLDIAIAKYGEGSVAYADALQLQMQINGTRKEYQKNDFLVREAISIYEKHLGVNDPKTLEMKQWLIDLKKVMGTE